MGRPSHIWIVEEDEILRAQLEHVFATTFPKAQIRAFSSVNESELEKNDVQPDLLISDGKLLTNPAEYLQTEVRFRKRSEHTLRESQRKYRTLVEQIPEIVFQLDTQRRIVFVNTAWKQITGYSQRDARGQPLSDFIWDADRKGLNNLLDQVVLHGQQRSDTTGKPERQINIRLPDASGNILWLNIQVDRELDSDGELSGYFGMAYNITESVRAKEETERALSKERELSQLRSQFVSMTSHEFRTPLSTILTSSELLEHYGSRWPYEKNLMHLKRIQESVRHIIQLMDDLLILGRAEAGKLTARRDMVDVTDLSYKVINEFHMNASEPRDVKFRPLCTKSEVFIDAGLFRQIFINILSNALKYSPVDSTIRVELFCDDRKLRLTVTDHGIGIPEKDMNQLFQPFFRAANASGKDGTGLGLSIVKRAVDALNGTIVINSELDKGTSVIVVLDIRQGSGPIRKSITTGAQP